MTAKPSKTIKLPTPEPAPTAATITNLTNPSQTTIKSFAFQIGDDRVVNGQMLVPVGVPANIMSMLVSQVVAAHGLSRRSTDEEWLEALNKIELVVDLSIGPVAEAQTL